ncbi:T9SS type A sorting domain-containing protein, partial [Larkinella soli]|uniref:T9SS type A sorting domain-containing protein n=1 Tax=Larkinella soli TaxID=1770527 RepID=UPI0013E2A455
PVTVTGNFEGYLDVATCNTLEGWLWNRDKGNLSYAIDFLEGETLESATLVGSVMADIYRQDLKDRGKGNGVHAYAFPVPPALKTGQNRKLWARVQGNSFVLKGSPKTINCASGARQGVASAEAELQLEVTPNPSRGPVVLRYRIEARQSAQLQVVDVLGRVVWQRSVEGSGQWQQQRVELPASASGLQVVQLQAGGRQVSRRLLIQR